MGANTRKIISDGNSSLRSRNFVRAGLMIGFEFTID